MLKFYTHKLGTTALALVCLGTFASGSAYGMDDKREEKNSNNNINISDNDLKNLKEEHQKLKEQLKETHQKLDDKYPDEGLICRFKVEGDGDNERVHIEWAEHPFQEKKHSQELKTENNSISFINPQPFIKDEIEKISSHNIIEEKIENGPIQKNQEELVNPLMDYQKEIVENLFEENLFEDREKYTLLFFQEMAKLQDTPQQTYFLAQILEKNKEFEEKKKLQNLTNLPSKQRREDNPISNKIEEISSHNNIDEKPQDFYVQKDEKRDLWVGMELVTKETQAFWKQRLGWDVFVLHGDQIKGEKRRKEKELNDKMSQGIFDISGNFDSEQNNEYIQNMNSVLRVESGSENPYYNSEDYSNENLMNWRFYGLNLSTEEQEDREKKVTKLSKIPQGEFESAWRGFAYNLSKYNKSKYGWDIDDKRKTWVSYVCSKPVEGPLYKSFEVTSPDIRMSMTVKLGEGELKTEKLGNIFYSPLGIYASLLGLAEAQKEGTVEKYKNISLLLHKNVAQFANKIDPQIKYAIVRPLKFMGSLLEKSGVLVSKEEAKFEHRNENYRYWVNGISFDADTYTWFNDSPFLGGAPQSSKREFPFVIASVKKLAELDLK